MKAQHDLGPKWFSLWWEVRISRSHKYKTTDFVMALNARWKLFEIAVPLDAKKANRLAGLSHRSGLRTAQEKTDYCSSDMTIEDWLLLCLSIAVPACSSIWLDVMLADSVAKSTSMMRPVAFFVLVEIFDRLL
jgi:hypothetical protein